MKTLLAGLVAFLLGVGAGWGAAAAFGGTSKASTPDRNTMGESSEDAQVIFRVIELSHIPPETTDSCDLGTIPPNAHLLDHEVYAVAVCDPMPDISVSYLLVHSTTSMAVAFHKIAVDNDVAPAAALATVFKDRYGDVGLQAAPESLDCQDALQREQPWAGFSLSDTDVSDKSHVDSPIGHGLEDNLQLRGWVACLKTDAGYTIVWTDSQTKFLSIATSNDAAALHAWWEESGGPLTEPTEMENPPPSDPMSN